MPLSVRAKSTMLMQVAMPILVNPIFRAKAQISSTRVQRQYPALSTNAETRATRRTSGSSYRPHARSMPSSSTFEGQKPGPRVSDSPWRQARTEGGQ